jgi:hypothetical protein
MKLIVLKLVGSIVLMQIGSSAATDSLRGATSETTSSQQHHRQDQQTVPSIKGFRWIDANTNKAVQIDGSNMVQGGQAVDLSDAPRGLTIEAITQGSPIGSVRFQFSTITNYVFVDNEARYFACGNNGTDILPCDIVSAPTTITASIYSGPKATGSLLSEYSAFVTFFSLSPPTLSLALVTPNKPDAPLTDNLVISLASTPSMSVRLDYRTYDRDWAPASVAFNYDNRSVVRIDNEYPFSMLTFVPTLGRHKLVVTAYKKRNARGESKRMVVSFTVTA